MEIVYFSVLVLYLRLVASQLPQSPCPDIFNYGYDSSGVYGIIRLRPIAPVSSLVIKTNFTVAARLLSSYVGRIEAEDSSNIIQNYNAGVPVTYRVHFPRTSAVPRLTALSVNGEVVCYGSPGQHITALSLQHTSFRAGVGGIIPAETPIETNAVPYGHAVPGGGQTIIYTFNEGDNSWSPVETMFYPVNNPAHVYNPPSSSVYDPITQPNRPDIYRTSTKRPIQKLTKRPFYMTTSTTTTTKSTVLIEIFGPSPETQYQGQNPIDEGDCGIIAGGNTNQPLIYNGEDYPRGDVPWLVTIYKSRAGMFSFICGGTLISDRHVVTAAHCMQIRSKLTPKKEFVIKVGVYDLDDWSDEISVSRKIAAAYIHTSYNDSTLENDILVFTLDKKVQFNDYIKQICLWRGPTDLKYIVNNIGVVAGWGDQGDSELIGRGLPKKARLPIVSTEQCRASKNDFHAITSDKTLCAGDRMGVGPCRGDSGGGLYLLEGGRWRLRGIISKSLKHPVDNTCNLKEYIVFTDTAQYLSWIKDILRQEKFN